MGIVLYSTGCPKCRVLETKLKAKGIGYAEINDVDVMEAKGIMNLPMLEVDGEILNFSEAIKWVNDAEEVFVPDCESCHL